MSSSGIAGSHGVLFLVFLRNLYSVLWVSQVVLMVKNLPYDAGDVKRQGFDLWIRKIPWSEGMTTHSSILAWRISWTEEPGEL